MTTQAHYLRLYRKADEILKQPDNPCEIRLVEGNISCSMTRRENLPEVAGRTWCCRGCEHLGPNGCTVQSLACKLGWCYTSASAIGGMVVGDHPSFQKIRELRIEATKLQVPMGHRLSLKENFQ